MIILFAAFMFFTWMGNFVLTWIKFDCFDWLFILDLHLNLNRNGDFVQASIAQYKNQAPKGIMGGRHEALMSWLIWVFVHSDLMMVAALSQERCCLSYHPTAKQEVLF